MTGDHVSGSRALWNALLLSLVAAVVIEGLMALVAMEGYGVLFKPPALYALGLLGLLALLVYRYLVAYTGRDPVIMASGLLGIALALAGVVLRLLGFATDQGAAWLVVAAYFLELVVGLRLYRYLEGLSRAWAGVFIGGAGMFILSLPLVVLLGREWALVPLVGNAVKALGLLGLLLVPRGR